MNTTAYLRFLNFINAVNEKAVDKKLDATEEALLNSVMLAHVRGTEVLVGDLLRLSDIGSQATLHGRVKNLIKLGYLKQVAELADGRKKRVIPTKQAQKYYANLSKLLAKAVSA